MVYTPVTGSRAVSSFQSKTYDKDDFEEPMYGNFDIILDHFSRTSQLHSTQHAPCAILYFVPILIGR